MYKSFSPRETELVEQERKHLEVVVLLITHNIYHLVYRVVAETQLCSTDILCHVYRCAVAAQQQFFVKSVVREVGPNRIIVATVENPLFKPAQNGLFSNKIGVAFVIYLVKIHAEAFVCLVKTLVNPMVHLLPKCAYLLVAGLPLHKHVACLGHKRRCRFGLLFAHALLHQLVKLRFIVLVKGYIVVAYEVVAFLAAAFGGLAIAPFLPSKHGFANMYATVVHNVGLYNPVAVCCNYVRQCIAKQVVAYVTQVKGLVCVGRGVFHHNKR